AGRAQGRFDAILKEWIQAGLAPPRGTRGDTLQFHHGLIQEAAYESQVLPDKRGAHLKAARALEPHYAQRAVQQPGEVARHYTAAGDMRAAIPWWLQAGRQALHVSACAEAAGADRKSVVEGKSGGARGPRTRERAERMGAL